MKQAQHLAQIGSWELDLTTNHLDWSDEIYRIFEIDQHSFHPSYDAFLSAVHPDDRSAVDQAYTDSVRNKTQYEIVHRLLMPDSRVKYVQERCETRYDAQGRPQRSFGTVQDITERKRAEAALRISEERYARATAIGKVGVWELDVVGERYHADVNRRHLFGYGPNELSPDPYVWLGLVHPDDQSIAWNAWERVVSGLTDEYHYELRMIRKDGTIIWTDVRGHAERDQRGHVTRLIGATADITERKVIQDTLVTKERELRTMLDALPIGVWFTDPQGHVLYGNPIGQRIWSGAVKVGLPDPRLGTCHWENIEATNFPHRWAIGSVLTKDQPVLNEMIEIETANGTRKTIRNTAVQVRNDTGAVQGAIVLNDDISERIHAEQTVRQNHELLSAIMDAATDLIFVKDLQGRYLHINEAGAQALGMTVKDVIGRNDYALWPTEMIASSQTTDRLVLETGETVTIEETAMLNGTPTVFLTTKAPYRDTEGRMIGIIGVSRDITERKRREDMLLNIVKGVTSSVGSAFFPSLTTHLASALRADYAIIGEVIGARHERIRTIAVYANGQIADNFEYDLRHTPCQNIMTQGAASYPSSLQAHFPEFHLLARLGADGYSGTPLRDSQGNMLGIMAVLYRQPIPDRELTESMLQILATRAASELERRRDEETIRTSEAKLRQSMLASNTGLWEWNTETNKVRFSREWKHQIGYTETELPDTFETWESRLHPDDCTRAVGYALQYRDKPVGAFRLDFRLRHKDGTYRWIDSHASFVTESDGRRVRLLGSHTDITERKQVEEALRRRKRELKHALEERNRISEDLHDGILQSIYAIGLGLESCKPLIADQPKKSSAKLKAGLHRTIGQLNHVLEDVRNFIAGLESRIMDGQEFDTVLQTMVRGMAASYSAPCRMMVEKAAAQRLSTEQAYHVMNVAREALSNSFRHSRAGKIVLSLKCLSRSVHLSVRDNGVGFNPSVVRNTGHGLANMESRATKTRGTFTLRSQPGGGTTIMLDLRYEEMR